MDLEARMWLEGGEGGGSFGPKQQQFLPPVAPWRRSALPLRSSSPRRDRETRDPAATPSYPHPKCSSSSEEAPCWSAQSREKGGWACLSLSFSDLGFCLGAKGGSFLKRSQTTFRTYEASWGTPLPRQHRRRWSRAQPFCSSANDLG